MAALGSEHLEPGRRSCSTVQGHLRARSWVRIMSFLKRGRQQVMDVSGIGANFVGIGILRISMYFLVMSLALVLG